MAGGGPHFHQSGREASIEAQPGREVLSLLLVEQGRCRRGHIVGLVCGDIEHRNGCAEFVQVVGTRNDDDQGAVRAQHPVELRQVPWSEDVEHGVGGLRTHGDRLPGVCDKPRDPVGRPYCSGYRGRGEVHGESQPVGGTREGRAEIEPGARTRVEDAAAERVIRDDPRELCERLRLLHKVPSVEHPGVVTDELGSPAQEADVPLLVHVEAVAVRAPEGQTFYRCEVVPAARAPKPLSEALDPDGPVRGG